MTPACTFTSLTSRINGMTTHAQTTCRFSVFVQNFGCHPSLLNSYGSRHWLRTNKDHPRVKQTLCCHSMMTIVGSRSPRRSPRETVAPRRLSATTKYFRRTAHSCANSSGHVNLIPPDDAAFNLASSGALCGLS